MASVAKLNIIFGVNLGQLQSGFRRAGSIVQTAVRGMTGAWTGALASFGLTGGALAFTGFGLKIAAEMEVARKSIEVLAGDAEKGRSLLQSLWNFAKETPFQFDEVQRAGRLLLGFGVDAEKATGWLQRLGDISAATGSSLNDLSQLFGRNSQQGRIYTRDINEFATRGIPIISELAKMFGVAESAIRGMAEEGQISFADIEEALRRMTDHGGRFFNLMEAMKGTLSFRWARFVDEMKELALAIGEKVVPAAKRFIEVVSGVVASVKEWASNIGEVQLKVAGMATAFLVVVTLGPSIVKAIMSIVAALRGMAIAQALIQAFSGPKGWATIAAGLLAAGAAFVAIDTAIASVNESMAAAEAQANAASAAAEQNSKATAAQAEEMWKLQRAADMASQAHEKLMASGRSIAEELRSPMERYIDTMTELQQLLHAAAISQEIFARGSAKAAEELFRAVDAQKELRDLERKPVAAVTRFTMQGFSASQAGQSEAAKLAEIQKQAREGDQRREELLRQAVELLKQKPPENPRPVRI